MDAGRLSDIRHGPRRAAALASGYGYCDQRPGDHPLSYSRVSGYCPAAARPGSPESPGGAGAARVSYADFDAVATRKPPRPNQGGFVRHLVPRGLLCRRRLSFSADAGCPWDYRPARPRLSLSARTQARCCLRRAPRLSASAPCRVEYHRAVWLPPLVELWHCAA